MPAVKLTEALNLFLSWPKNENGERKPYVLIGHNFEQFDFPRIIRAFEKCELTILLVNL